MSLWPPATVDRTSRRSKRKENRVVNRVTRPLRTNQRRRIRLADPSGQREYLRQSVARKVPAIDLPVLVVDQSALVHRVDRGTVDAPLANRVRVILVAMVRIRGWPRDAL